MLSQKTFPVLTIMVTLVLFWGGDADAQYLECNTIFSGPDSLIVEGIAPDYDSILESTGVSVFVHILRNTDGSGGLSTGEVDGIISKASLDLLQLDVGLVEIGRDEIFNTSYMANPDSAYSAIFLENPHFGAIDIYLGPAQGGAKGRAGGIPSGELVLSGDIISNSAISHLLGNCLGLYETDETEFGDETPDGANSETAGDLISDTLADPGLFGYVQGDCTLSASFLSTFPAYNPPPSSLNIMSNSRILCWTNFSVVQRKRVLASLEKYQVLKDLRTVIPISYRDFTANTNLLDGDYPVFANGAVGFDFMGDGLQKDILVSGHAHPTEGENLGFAGKGNGFHASSGVPIFDNVTHLAFSSDDDPPNGTTGYIVADYDNDGDLDFYAPNHIYGDGGNTHRFYEHDLDSDGVFKNVTGTVFSSTHITKETLSGAWGDYNGDGYLDLLVAVGTQGGSSSLILYKNEQVSGGELTDREFVDVTSSVGLGSANSKVLSLLWIDLDKDHDMDIVTIQFVDNSTSFSKLFENTGGAFVNRTNDIYFPARSDLTSSGTFLAGPGDFDNDGDIDIAWQGLLRRGYFENTFEDGEGMPSLTTGILDLFQSMDYLTPSGFAVFDYDLDGALDFGVSNINQSSSRVHRVIVNDLFGTESFLDRQLSNDGTATTEALGFGSADWNMNGYTEVLIANRQIGGGAQHAFYKYLPDYVPGTEDYHWVGIRLEAAKDEGGVGSPCNTRGIGATVIVSTPGGHTQAQVVDGGSGNAGQHDLDLSFGLGTYSGPVDVAPCANIHETL